MAGILKVQAHYVRICFSCSQSGIAQLYYDSGYGYNENESVSHCFIATNERITIHFRIPPIEFRSLRFDPLQGAAEINIYTVDIYLFGDQYHAIPLYKLKPVFDIESFEIKKEAVHICTLTDANDPCIEIETLEHAGFEKSDESR